MTVTKVQLTDDELGIDLAPATLAEYVENADGDTLEDVEAGAQVNKIESIIYDGSALPITNKSVTVPKTDISGKADKATTLAGYGITDAYTKTATDTAISTAVSPKANSADVYTKSEIDGKLSGAMHFKGSVATVSALPSTGKVQGDMYNVLSTGANYAWDGSTWDKLSENIDLSGLVPNTRTVNGKALSSDIVLSASDVSALPNNTPIPSKTSDLTNDSGFIDGITSSDVTTALGYTPYSAANPNGYTSNVGTVTKVNNTSPDANGNVSIAIPTVPTNVSAFTNDANYITATQLANKKYISYRLLS